MGTLHHLPRRPAPSGTPALVALERAIFTIERSLVDARRWLKRARGAGRARAIVEVEELTAELGRLERERRRMAGAELAVLKGGKR